jgi:hypothetical protein
VTQFLVHYSRGEPFRSLTSHPPQKWPSVIASLTEKNAWGLNRFSDSNYLKRRLEVEQILRNEFVAKGGEPDLINPIYAYLGRHTGWESHKLNVGYAVDLKNISATEVSFTYGDSLLAFNEEYRMQSGESYKNSLCRKVFTVKELNELLLSPEYPRENPLRVEVQLWRLPDPGKIRKLERQT